MADVDKKLDQLSVKTIRMLAVDMVERAGSGHPGLPLGAAPMAYVLWTRYLRHNPDHPDWPDRDRFILSAGHGSTLLYALLHLSGYGLSLNDLKRFRQWQSRTPGHPEYGLVPGVEATTGPLGQGFAMGVGMAIAEAYLADSFNRPGINLVDHYTYALVSDGDLMEGVSGEAASLAGTLALGKLIYLYDDNGISIEGSTDITFTDDVSRKFQACGWQVIRVSDGNDLDSIDTAIHNARGETEKPSLIMVRTHIGYGSPKQDTAAAHGEPLGAEACQQTKKHFGWPLEPDFNIPDKVLDHFNHFMDHGREAEKEWHSVFTEYKKAYQDEANRFQRQMDNLLPLNWKTALPSFHPEDGPIATRSASGKVINSVAEKLSNLVGGSADLAPSTKTLLSGYPDFGSGLLGARNMRFGVREHAMGAIINGMALHGGLIPYGATFFVFSDYMRPALRLAALMDINSRFIFTHDSVGVGEDGPTHQPVEHLASLRAIPGFTLIRPADANETCAAWVAALEAKGPVALILSRQKLPILDTKVYPVYEGVAKGAYILADAAGNPDLIIIATGSEVHLALEAKQVLDQEGIAVRVVSMPSWEVFLKQAEDYQDQVLPPRITARLAVEAGSSFGWRRWVGPYGDIISIDEFGASAPGPEIMKHFGLTVENIVARSKTVLNASLKPAEDPGQSRIRTS